VAKKQRRQIIIFREYFFEFYKNQSLKVREKIDYSIKMVLDLDPVPQKFFKKLIGTDLYEIRTEYGGNIYRIFCFFDKGNLVVLLHGITKKSQKTPIKELAKAKRLQKEYYDGKEE